MSWIARLFFRQKMEAQLDKELRFHIDQHAAELIEQGVAPDAARRHALVAFGGTEAAREECRDARGTRWLEDFARDIRYALRTLRQKPGFAAVALLTLALGTGATTLMFTVMNGVLFKPLPYHDPDRLVVLQEKTDKATTRGNLWYFAYPNYLDLKRGCRSLDLMALTYGGGILAASGRAEYVDGFQVSADVFSVLGIQAVRGRVFSTEDDHPGAAPVAILGYKLWQRWFAGDASAIGTAISFDGKSYTVVGIAPEGLRFEGHNGFLGGEPDVLTPLGQVTSRFMQNREGHGITVWGRLHPGVALAQARAEIDTIGHQLALQYAASNQGRTFVADRMRPDVGDARSTLWLLLGAVSLVLLIACVNVASLLLARAVSRDRELAVRMSLGASRGRVVRQCLTESCLLALGGGLLGTAIAFFGFEPFLAFWPGTLPRADQVRVDWHVLLFSLGISVLCGLLFGLAPALRIPANNLEAALRQGSRTVAGGSRRLHNSFVISEVALAVVLLVSAGVLGRTLLRLSSLDPGINIHDVLVSRLAIAPSLLPNPAKARAAWDEVLSNARALPGVEAAATVDTVPMRSGDNVIGYWFTATEPPQDQQALTLANSVSPDYLRVMRIPLRRGRFISDQDRLNAEGVVVIDEVMAQQAFRGEDPIGKHLSIGLGKDPVTVVGVVGHVRQFGLAGDDQAQVRAQLYYPFAQVPDGLVRRWSQLMSIAVRTSGDPAGILPSLRQAVRGATGDQVLYEVDTLEQLAQDSLVQQRFLMMLFGVFAALALALAAIGIYGVLAYLTNQRMPELAIRVALGASASGVMRMVLKESLQIVAVGALLGTAGAWAANRILLRVVEGARSGGPITFIFMIAILFAAALAASAIPACRASRVDPLTALRSE